VRETAPPWDPRRIRLARTTRIVVAVVLIAVTLGVARQWLSGGIVTFDDHMKQEYGEKSLVEFRSEPQVERRVAQVDRMVARIDADRTLRERLLWSGQRQVFDDGREIRKIRRSERPEPGKPVAYVYYYDHSYVAMIRVLWSASAQAGADEERFYFDTGALPPLIRWVQRDGRVAQSWSPYHKDGHGRFINYEAPDLLKEAIESRVCDHSPASLPCRRLGFEPR
jgi:hypothetical protein